MDKTNLRAEIRARLAALSDDALRAASAAITRRVLASEVYRDAGSVFCYVSTDREPDTRAILEDAWAAGKTVCIPKCTGPHRMIAVQVHSWDDLAPGKFGLLEPISSTETAESPELAIVPCMAAGKDRSRLGHGGGYYDRFLQVHRPHTLCLCFEALLTDGIPMDPLDVPMDAVVTEQTIY